MNKDELMEALLVERFAPTGRPAVAEPYVSPTIEQWHSYVAAHGDRVAEERVRAYRIHRAANRARERRDSA